MLLRILEAIVFGATEAKYKATLAIQVRDSWGFEALSAGFLRNHMIDIENYSEIRVHGKGLFFVP